MVHVLAGDGLQFSVLRAHLISRQQQSLATRVVPNPDRLHRCGGLTGFGCPFEHIDQPQIAEAFRPVVGRVPFLAQVLRQARPQRELGRSADVIEELAVAVIGHQLGRVGWFAAVELEGRIDGV